ncbi:Putative cytochrome P450 [Colletotrichum destructivum]|uniref:Cytochrome P450 n=1 Tax=Colletotrichum destructivum TaxID=34406 RepID=A0AAX4IXM2_9PEZI|nr:Putative cytochrome P450 [Colletotrichum destructivum]
MELLVAVAFHNQTCYIPRITPASSVFHPICWQSFRYDEEFPRAVLKDSVCSTGNVIADRAAANPSYRSRRKDSSIFSITVMGDELYIATSPADVTAILKETKSLTFDPIIRLILGEFGMAKESLDALFEPRQKYNNRNWMDRQHDIFRSQMHPTSDKGEALSTRILRNIDQSMQSSLLNDARLLPLVRTGEKAVSLWKLCSHVLVDASTRAFWGDSLVHIAPDFVDNYLAFDAAYWKRDKSKKDANSCRQKNLIALEKWLRSPKAERSDASWLVKSLEQDYHAMGITDNAQIAAQYFLYHEVINANAFKSCFWLLAHVIFDKKLRADLEEEMLPAVQRHDQQIEIDIHYLLNECHLLGSVYEETLRLCSDPTGIRQVVQETKIGRKTVYPGHKLLMPYRQMHLDDMAFGASTGQFMATRFLNNKLLSKAENFRPFGGGNGHCPGRFLARREVYMLAALLLFRFEVDLSPGSEMPVIDEKAPTGGILRPVAGHDVLLDIKL